MSENIVKAPHVPPFVTFVTSAVPMVFDNSLSYYEALCALWKWLQDDVVNVINNNATVTEDYIDLTNKYIEKFNELKEYVDTYFDNLDVQEEINNKLDEMAEDGTLEEIMAHYLEAKVAWTFDTVAEMKVSTNLTNGSYAQTLGYYSVNDGGAGLYKIRPVISSDIVDEGRLIAVNDVSLVAELVIKDETINFKQLGAKSNSLTDATKTDNKTYLLKYDQICKTDDKTYKLFIPSGYWFFSDTHLDRFAGYDIQGNSSFPREPIMGTVICPLNASQSYIWKFGGNAAYSNEAGLTVNSFVCQSKLKNLYFTTNVNEDGYSDTLVSDGLLILDCCMYWEMDNIYIQRYYGIGLTVRNSWEINIGNLMFRSQKGVAYGNMRFGKASSITGVSSNVSAFNIQNLMFEGSDGYFIKSEKGSGFSHNHINHINIEHTFHSQATNMSANEDVSTYTPIHLITGMFRSLIIDSINFFSTTDKKLTVDGTTYYFGSLFHSDEPANANEMFDCRFSVMLGQLSWRHSGHTAILWSHNSSYYNKMTIGSISFLDTPNDKPFNVDQGLHLTIGATAIDDTLHYKDETDAYNYYCRGKDSNNLDTGALCYDSTAPTMFGLIVNVNSNNTGCHLINKYGTSAKVRILYKTGSQQDNIVVRIPDGSYQTVSCPDTSGAWAWVETNTFADATIGNIFNVRSYHNNIAKIEIIRSA